MKNFTNYLSFALMLTIVSCTKLSEPWPTKSTEPEPVLEERIKIIDTKFLPIAGTHITIISVDSSEFIISVTPIIKNP